MSIEEVKSEFFRAKKSLESAKILFDNITQKLAETFVLYDCIPILGFEESALAKKRLDQVKRLVHHDSTKQIFSILASPSDCWGNILD